MNFNLDQNKEREIFGPKILSPENNKAAQSKFISEKNNSDFECQNEQESSLYKYVSVLDISEKQSKPTCHEIKLLSPSNKPEKLKLNLDMIHDFSRDKSRKDNDKRAIYLLNTFKRAKLFAKEIKKKIQYKHYKNLKQTQKDIINDKCEYSEEKINKISQKLIKFFYFLLKSLKFESFTKFKITSINPDLKMKKLWDFSLLFLTFINFFILPLEVCFFVKSPQNEIFSSYQIIHILKLFNVFVYGLDIILNFFTGFFYEGAIIKDLKMIRRKYLSRLFLYDLLAYIPIFAYVFETDLVDFNKNYLLLNIMFCFIFKKFNKIIKDFEEFLIQEKESFENFFSISCLYLKILLIAHVFACFWYLIGTYPPEKKSWLTVYGLESSSWDHQYLNSLYWSLVTMVTVGYGDITPQNNLEKIFCIIAMLVGFTIFGFTLGNLGDIIHKMNANEQELYDTYKVITRVMKKNKVDFDFQFKVRKYLGKYLKENKEREKEEEIYNKLSKNIKNEYLYQIYGKKLLTIPFFKENFSEKSILSISNIIKKVELAPGETLVKLGDIQNTNFYLLFKGEIEFSIPNSSSRNKPPLYSSVLKGESSFNELHFIANIPQKFDIKTLTFCSFYVINREDFTNLLNNEFPNDFEKFCYMKDKILFENNYENLKNSCCHSCRSKDHFIKDCPFIHFTPNRDLLFKKLQYSQPNDRNILFKRKPTKIFSRLNCLKYKDNLKKIRSKFKLEKRGMFMKMRELITIKEIYDFDKDFSSNQNLEFKDDSYIESEKSDLNLSKSLILQSDPEIEPKNKTHNENEEMDSPIASFNRLDKSKKSTLNLTSKNKTTKSAFKLEEYELNVIEKINERRAIILKKERTGLDIIKLKSYDLFDFEFETISFNNHYYYRNHNFDNCIFKFKKYLKNKERRRNKDKRDEGMMSPLFQ